MEIFEFSVLVTPCLVKREIDGSPEQRLALATYQNILKTQKLQFVERISHAWMEAAPTISKEAFCKRAGQFEFVFEPSALRLYILNTL